MNICMKRKYITKADLLIVLHYLGYIMEGLGVLFLVPILVALIFGEYIKVSAFLIPCFISFTLGLAFTRKLTGYNKLRLKHGILCMAVGFPYGSSHNDSFTEYSIC